MCPEHVSGVRQRKTDRLVFPRRRKRVIYVLLIKLRHLVLETVGGKKRNGRGINLTGTYLKYVGVNCKMICDPTGRIQLPVVKEPGVRERYVGGSCLLPYIEFLGGYVGTSTMCRRYLLKM